MAGFADALRSDKFTGVHFKRWQVKVRLWLTVLHAWEARLGIPAGDHSPKERRKLMDANDIFVGCVISVLHDHLVDVYIHITDAKELWDALAAKYDATDAGSELYTMESFHDFRMVNNRKVVAGCIIAKLPSSWRNFATVISQLFNYF